MGEVACSLAICRGGSETFEPATGFLSSRVGGGDGHRWVDGRFYEHPSMGSATAPCISGDGALKGHAPWGVGTTVGTLSAASVAEGSSAHGLGLAAAQGAALGRRGSLSLSLELRRRRHAGVRL